MLDTWTFDVRIKYGELRNIIRDKHQQKWFDELASKWAKMMCEVPPWLCIRASTFFYLFQRPPIGTSVFRKAVSWWKSIALCVHVRESEINLAEDSHKNMQLSQPEENEFHSRSNKKDEEYLTFKERVGINHPDPAFSDHKRF